MISSTLRRSRSKWLILLLVIQILFLAGIAGFHYSTLWYGKKSGFKPFL